MWEGSISTITVWQVVWFAAVWNNWKNRNSLVFTATKKGLDAMLELIKIHLWQWLKNKGPFLYPNSCGLNDPRACLVEY
uniref:Reverse transcriptase zinc-binding domain-containing protein n=1 Tax=Glycine max TaxID=3847 RepID=A0A0R0GNB9_SOYBN